MAREQEAVAPRHWTAVLPREVINRTVNFSARLLRRTRRIDRVFHIFDRTIKLFPGTLGRAFLLYTPSADKHAGHQHGDESPSSYAVHDFLLSVKTRIATR